MCVKTRWLTALLLLLSKPVAAQGTKLSDFIIAPSMLFLCALLNVIEQIAGPIAALVLAWAGLRWIAAQDDIGERKKAKQMILNVLLGLVIILVAVAIVHIITNVFITC